MEYLKQKHHEAPQYMVQPNYVITQQPQYVIAPMPQLMPQAVPQPIVAATPQITPPPPPPPVQPEEIPFPVRETEMREIERRGERCTAVKQLPAAAPQLLSEAAAADCALHVVILRATGWVLTSKTPSPSSESAAKSLVQQSCCQ